MSSQDPLVASRVNIRLEPLGKTVAVERGSALRALLHGFGVEFPCGGHGRCAACRIKVTSGTLSVTPDEAAILTPGERAQGWRLACRAVVDADVTLEIGQWETVILADHSSFAFAPRPGRGIAVDLGTTTIVAQLLDLETGHVLAVRTAVNPQTVHGADIMIRIHAALAERRQAELVGQSRRVVAELCTKLLRSAQLEAAPPEAVPLEALPLEAVVIAGNTAMHHLFCDIDVSPLSRAPFEPVDGGTWTVRAHELGWSLPGDPTVQFLPCVGGFVGSDVLCGVLATCMHQSETPFILVDLGTNGEIVVGNRERMLCASTAAGPAFEGGRISRGMRATTGAISEVWSENGEWRCRVIGDVAARGVCGSGLVDAVAVGLDLGLIEPSGRLARHGQPLEVAPSVALTQGDIRELQLAKAAIAAGIQILRERFGEAARAPIPIYLAGAFGNYVNKSSARRIGLINAPEASIEPAGNTALLGAKLVLFRNPPEDELQRIRARMRHIPLAAVATFHDSFIRETRFPNC
ncbi:MAG: Methyltransferase corrinoid activation protein [Deltaproteobacteria bacterium]|nr:Methyltransferase corrinoid activation protein [Deltaproteobacteria bacterium]